MAKKTRRGTHRRGKRKAKASERNLGGRPREHTESMRTVAFYLPERVVSDLDGLQERAGLRNRSAALISHLSSHPIAPS